MFRFLSPFKEYVCRIKLKLKSLNKHRILLVSYGAPFVKKII